MTIDSLGLRGGGILQDLKSMRAEMEKLQRQFGTGKRAETYGELGRERTVALSFRARLTVTETYQSTITSLDARLKIADSTLDRINELSSQARGSVSPNEYLPLSDGRTQQQVFASQAMGELMTLLNTEVGGRHLFAGRAVGEKPVADLNAILYGENGKAGLTQVTRERVAADTGGPTGTGRVDVAGTAGTVTLTETGGAFGFKIRAAAGPLTNGTVTGGGTGTVTIDLTGQPVAGEQISLEVGLPDGTTRRLAFTIGDTNDAISGTIALGATPDDTAANMRTVLSGRLRFEAASSLTAASGLAAGRSFFDTFQGKATQRVSGSPAETATAMVAATPADTVAWYRGDQAVGHPRADATARVDGSLTVEYGMRANELGFTELAANLAAVALTDVSAGTDEAKARHFEVTSRLKSNLGEEGVRRAVSSIQIEIAAAHTAAKQASERHTVATKTIGEMLDSVEGIDQNEVAVQLLALQTRLQASYEATALVSRLSLTNYL
jgi:flagellar hook-associated protein 3 FlgL